MSKTSLNKIILKDTFSLWGYQTKVVDWMEKQEQIIINGIRGGLVCLTMGLGKTLIALYFIMTMRQKYKERFPTIIIVSKTLLYEWKSEGIEKFFTGFKVLYYHKDLLGNGYSRITTSKLLEYDIVIITYDTVCGICKKYKMLDHIEERGEIAGIHFDKVINLHHRKRPELKEVHGPQAIYDLPWERVICDESQRFANPKTVTFKSLMALYATNRWCLTGTPIRNYETDIWAQLRFCGFNKIINSRLWRYQHFVNYNCIDYIYMLNYEQAEVKMPELIAHTYSVEMDEQQTELYKTMLTDAQNMFALVLKNEVSYMCILALFVRLRQSAIAPYMLVSKKRSKNKKIDEMVEKIGNNVDGLKEWLYNIDSTAGVKSPKIQKIVDIIKNVPVGEKIIIFSMFTSCFEIFENAMLEEDILYDILSGDSNMKERLRILKQFKHDPSMNVLFVHYKVGGEGINLTQANHVICVEPWWTHAVHYQGIYRSWRRGQTKPVHVYWVLTENTIESMIIKMCDSKQNMSNSYLNGEEMDERKVGIGKYEMKQLLFQNTN